MTDVPPIGLAKSAGILTRPTAKSEWTLLSALAGMCVFGALVLAVLAFAGWDKDSASQRIWFMGWMGLLAMGGQLLTVAAIMSPFVGTVRASGLGANVEIDGRPPSAPQS